MFVTSLAVIAAGIAGLAASFIARYAANRCRRAFRHRGQLSEIARDLRRLVGGTSTKTFLADYLRLLRHVLQLVAVQFAVLLVSLVTLTVVYAVSCGLLGSIAEAEFVYIAVSPSGAVAVENSEGKPLRHAAQSLLPAGESAMTIVVDGNRLVTVSPELKQAYARSPLAQAGLACLGFKTLVIDPSKFPDIASCVSRPLVHATNPLWPWLSDVEFSFFGAAVVGSFIAAFMLRPPA